MTTHSSILAWRTPWTEEPGRVQFMGSQRVRHDWPTLTFLNTTFSGTNKLIPDNIHLKFNSNSFAELKFICYNMHLFKVCNSTVFSIYTELGNHQHNLVFEDYHTETPFQFPFPLSSPPPSFLPPTSPRQSVLYFKSANAGDIGDLGSNLGSGRSGGGMATHSSILAWEILWTEEPGRLQSIGSHRVEYDWSNLAHRYMSFLTFPINGIIHDVVFYD